MNDSLQFHLVSLRDDYERRAAAASGTPGESVLADGYLDDAMAVLTVSYGASCAEQVRLSDPGRTMRTAPSSRAASSGVRADLPFLTRVRRRLRECAEDWHRQWLESAELGEPRNQHEPDRHHTDRDTTR